MKKSVLLPILAAILCGCASNEPAPPVVETSATTRPAKAPPSVSSQKAEDFRAIERPSTYSE